MTIKSLVSCLVRPEDIDHYNHLTYSRYLDYYKQGWFSLLREVGIYPQELVKNGQGLFVVDTNVKYLNQVKPESHLNIESTFCPYGGGLTFSIKHIMTCDQLRVSVCQDKNIFVDLSRKKPRPIPIPEYFSEILRRETEGNNEIQSSI